MAITLRDKSNSCKGTLPSHARCGLDLPCAGFAQSLLEARELEGLVQHHKALLHGVAGAVAVAGCEQTLEAPDRAGGWHGRVPGRSFRPASGCRRRRG